MTSGHTLLNLATWCKGGTQVLGPGKRLAIWTQGCLKQCPGCVSPEFRELKAAQIVDAASLATYAIAHPEFSGLTISGGEPFLQASALVYLIRLIRERREAFSVILFTGFYREELNWPEAADLLEEVDLLIDGPYLENEFSDKGLRGSTNQRFHFLTNRLKGQEEEIVLGERAREIQIEEDSLFPIGIPTKKGAFKDIFDELRHSIP